MNLGKMARVAVLVATLCVGIGAWLFLAERREVALRGRAAEVADWRKVDVWALRWSSEELVGRSPSMSWTVEYEYVVDGASYRGHHICVDVTALRVSYGTYPIDMTVRLNEMKSVWYDPRNPSRSAAFKRTGADLGPELRRAYVELTAQAKEHGRWP